MAKACHAVDMPTAKLERGRDSVITDRTGVLDCRVWIHYDVFRLLNQALDIMFNLISTTMNCDRSRFNVERDTALAKCLLKRRDSQMFKVTSTLWLDLNGPFGR
jgi:hypothetical protein